MIRKLARFTGSNVKYMLVFAILSNIDAFVECIFFRQRIFQHVKTLYLRGDS